MSKNRIKVTSPSIKTRTQAEDALREIAELTIARNAATGEMDARLVAVRSEFEPGLTSIEARLEEKTELLKNWAEANPGEFKEGLKSLSLTHGSLGWRTGLPSLKTLRGWTFDRVLEKIKGAAGLLKYIRTKEEVNKQGLINDRDILGPDGLRSIGVEVKQEESFFVEPTLEKLEIKQVA